MGICKPPTFPRLTCVSVSAQAEPVLFESPPVGFTDIGHREAIVQEDVFPETEAFREVLQGERLVVVLQYGDYFMKQFPAVVHTYQEVPRIPGLHGKEIPQMDFADCPPG